MNERPHNEIDETGVDRSRQFELLTRFLALSQNIEAFQDKKFDELFENENSRRSVIGNITFDQFVDLLNGTNGVLRDKDQSEWGMDGYEVGMLMGNLYPPPHD